MSEKKAGTPMATDYDYAAYIETSLGTHFATNLSDSMIVADFKKKILEDHKQCFPAIGDLKMKSIEVKRKGKVYRLADSMIVKTAFQDKSCCFMTVDICKVEPCDGLANGIDSSVPMNDCVANGRGSSVHQPKGLVSGVARVQSSAAVQVNEKLLSQDVDMSNKNPVIVESQHDLSKLVPSLDAKEMKDSRITDVVVRPELYHKKSSKKRKSSRMRHTSSSQPLTLYADQVEGPVPVASLIQPQTVTSDQTTQDNLKKKAMGKGDDASETAMVTGLSYGDPVSPKKASHKRKKSKRSSHSTLLLAEQVEGSMPVISSTEPQQTNNRNDSSEVNGEDRTMIEAVVNSPSKKAHADKHAAEVSEESQEINFSKYFVPSTVEKAPKAKVVGRETECSS